MTKTLSSLAEDVIELLALEKKFQDTKKYNDLAKYKEKRMLVFLECTEIIKEENS